MSATQKLIELIELIEPYFQLNRPPHHTLSRMSLFSDDVVLFSDEVVLFPGGLQFSIG
ncbi:hypothetical protein YPC_0868 [Yersinia pestis biovar Medievalis str. Harbin 35]|nr:hypothetical protein YPC_0868 [Yersinia pestis biovar Medievalis str. Harbin 35]